MLEEDELKRAALVVLANKQDLPVCLIPFLALACSLLIPLKPLFFSFHCVMLCV